MRATTRRRIAVPVAITSGLLLSGLLVWQTSYAAFSANTENAGNNFQSGSVSISDNDSNSALFNATALKPGSTATNCITVAYTGSLASNVRLTAAYTTGDATTNALAQYLNFKIEDIPLTGTCDTPTGGTPTEILASDTTLQAKVASLTPAAGVDLGWNAATNGAQKRYRFTYTLQDNNSAQDKSANVGFTWTARSN